MKARRFSPIASRPCQSATPRLHTAFSAKQSKPLPKVLSSISFHMAKSHSGVSVFVKVIVFILFSVFLLMLPEIFFVFASAFFPHHCVQKLRSGSRCPISEIAAGAVRLPDLRIRVSMLPNLTQLGG